MSKALVIGYGSIGERHARLLTELGLDVAVVSRRRVEHQHRFGDLVSAMEKFDPDYVVIASRTSEHLDDFEELADIGFSGTVLVEKPLFITPSALPKYSFASTYVAYNLRFHPIVKALKDALDQVNVYAVHAYVGQYLPQWRPGRDYREGTSANRAQGGGVLRDLSHELDYLTWMLGGWRRVTGLGGKVSHLEINSDDAFALLIEMENCPIVGIQMDYLNQTVRREVVAQTSKGTIRADLVAGKLEIGGEERSFACGRDDTYIAQHRAAIEGDKSVLCSLEEGRDIVRLIAATETSTAKRIWINRENGSVVP